MTITTDGSATERNRGLRYRLTTAELAAVATVIADKYNRALIEGGNPLAASGRLTDLRPQQVGRLVTEVAARLGVVPAPSVDVDDRPFIAVIASGASPHDSIRALHMLFTTALAELVPTLDADPVEIASVLAERLFTGVADALEAIAVGQVGETFIREEVDTVQLRQHLSQREAEIFEYLVNNTSTRQIAADLDITVRTVKNHITNIGRRLNGIHGRVALLRWGRETGIIVAIPAIMITNTIATTINMT